jgi:primosomal protein N'
MALSKTLNEEQQAAYNEIMSAVGSDHGALFFVDGPGGTGKTYLYRACSLLYIFKTRLPWQQQHLVLLPQ